MGQSDERLKNGIHTPHHVRVHILEITRRLLNCITMRGRFRLGIAITSVCLPKCRVVLPHRCGGMMVFDLSNPHEVSMYFDFFAPELSRVMRRVLGPGDTFIDCGANIGYFSCLASSLVGATGRVILIDANPQCVKRIQESKTIGDYANMEIIPYAIGEGDGEIEFHLADDPMYSSLANLDALDFTSTESTVLVPLRRLDDIVRDADVKRGRRIRLLKLDVEGAEIDVIRGAEETISTSVLDFLYVEMHPKQIALRGQEPDKLERLLGARGFKCAERLGANVFLYESYA